MEGVKNAVQNGIENLSGTNISANAHPEDGYRFQARTRIQLLESEALAANHGNVRAGKEILDPAAQFDTTAAKPEAAPPKAEEPKGWLM